jgi:tryptophan synthase alpha chain
VNRIQTTFSSLKQSSRTALMPYLTLGYPEKNSALDLIPALVSAGADLVELGVPFSDPLADGATIQVATQQSLANGMTLDLCLEQAHHLRVCGITIPFVLMGYYNPIFQFGFKQFTDRAADAGIDGVIVPDLPPEEAEPLIAALRVKDILPIFLLAPTSDLMRVRKVVELTEGFIYLVSLVGVTGARDDMSPDLATFVQRVHRETEKPLAVGFGISTPQQAARVSMIADGVIVGSALIKVVGTAKKPVDAAYSFVESLRHGIDNHGIYLESGCETD